MKKALQKRVLAFVLVLAMLWPDLTGLMATVQADTTPSTTYGEAAVYDIYDLTGSQTNTVKGTDETWDGVCLGEVSPEHKENIVFKTKLTMGAQQVRLALNAKEGTSIYDPPGYAVYINDNNGAPYIAIKRNQNDLVWGSVASVAGTYELEIGIVDILTDGVRTGKHLYVKMDGAVVCEVDDTNGYLTGDALGTKLIDFHYGAAIQMDTTKTGDNTHGTANIYDIFDLTGSQTNTVKGTGDDNWSGVTLGAVSAEHKENIVFKTKLTMGEQEVRLALNAKEGTSIYDPPGYAVYINHNGGAPYIAIKRNQNDLVLGSVASVAGTYELEIGIVDILTDGVRTGKHLYVKMDGAVVCEVDDTNGYLTGDALGTKLIDFHYGAALQMDTTKTGTNTYGTANVYDIYDLTGSQTNTVKGTGDDNWSGVTLGAVSAEHKENIVFKTKLTMGEQEVRLSLNALDGASIYDPTGYAVYINHNGGAPYIAIKRNQNDLVLGSVASVAGTYELEIGLVDILTDGVRTGKHLYVKKDGEVVCEVDDTNGYLTGDALGTKLIDFHYGAAIQMDTTKTSTKTYGTANVYDIYDLTGSETNTVKGTGDDNWSGVTLGAVSEEHKENMAFVAKLTVGAQEVRLSINALDGASVWDPAGYAVYLYGADNRVEIRRNNATLQDAAVEGVAGTYIFEAGIVDILQDGNRVGKHLYVKMNDVLVCEYDDMDGYLTGDALGTKLIDFHYGAAIQMDTTKTSTKTYGEANVYDIYDLTGSATNTVNGTDATWDGVTLGAVSAEHKENIVFKTKLTMGEQEVRLSINALDGDSIYDPTGYAVYINHNGGAPYIAIKRNQNDLVLGSVASVAGTYELEIGLVDILTDGVRTGKHLYVKIDGVTVCEVDDTDGYLTGDALGTKLIDFHYGAAIQMDTTKQVEAPPELTAAQAKVYDLYDLTFRETLKVDHSDDNGNINWGVLIGSVEEAHKGNVALKTKVNMSTDQQQNLIIGLGLNGHWPVSGGFGYQIEFIADPNSENDSLRIHKNSSADFGDLVCCFGAEQDFDFNGSFRLEVGVVDLLDDNKKVGGRRIYVKVDGRELMHYDDTKDIISGDSMGTVVAAYASSGSVTLGTCVNGIPSTDVKVYDIFDLSGRASLKLTRTDAGGEVIWSNEIGQITDTNNMNYALRVNMDTSQVDRSTLQELIVGLCKDSDLFDKTGYRLSFYFYPDGSTSLVLRDSATDEVLAGASGAFPKAFELEFGMTDFYNSSKEKLGNKLYIKIDGEEALSYVDEDTNRARGNLLCAYTTSPITLTTKYGYTTIPVTYVVDGEKVETSKYITANTDVVIGKRSVIDIALGNKDEFTSVVIQQVLLNGQPIKPVSEKKGVYVFELEAPSDGDELTVEIQVHSLTVDEAQVYDLYELTGKKEIVIPANSVDQIGTLFADGQEGVLNRAIRFAYYIPKTGGGLRLGYGSATSDIWSRVGTHIEIWCGFATISHGFHVSALSSGNTDIFQPDSWSIVEVGIVKCYEDGVYKYDRWYVKAGRTLEEMELITYYDSTQRYDSTLNIMARTPDTGDDFIVASTLDVRQVTDISEEAAKENATAAFKPLFVKGESVKIVVFPKEGKALESLYVDGEKVDAMLTSDGGYVFTVENAQEDIQFSYILSDDARLYSITADDADNLEVILDKTSVSAGGCVTVQIKMDGGYTLKSLIINEVDFLPMASYNKTTLTYTLTVSGIREDKHIQAQAEKLSQDGPVAAAGLEENENKTSLPVILAVVAAAVAVLGGVIAAVVTRARKKGRKQ